MVRKKILIVEDTPLAAKMASVIIEDLGYEPVVAMNGEQAIDLFTHYQFDFVFMDIGLPDMSGFAITAEFRSIERSRTHKAPIVALTAHSTDEFKLRAKKVDMNSYLIKPLTKKDAERVIKQYMNESEIVEHPLQAAIKHIPALLFYKDAEQRYVACTEQFAKWIGLRSSHQILGKADSELTMMPNAAKVLGVTDAATLVDQYDIPKEHYVIRQFDVAKTSLTGGYISPVDDPHTICMQAGITDMQSPTAFLANVSHDLRMPLHVILGSASIIEKMATDPVVSEMVQGILEYGKLLSEYIANILVYMKAADQQLPIAKTEFSIRKAVHDVTKMIRLVLGDKDVCVEAMVADNIPDMVITDKHRLFRVLQNLLGNAAKYTHQGRIDLQVSIKSNRNKRLMVDFSVKDTGIGIEQKKVKAIFDKFHQLNDTATQTEGGVGLGLSIVKQFVDDLQGDIVVESKLDNGSCFICTLPLEVSANTLEQKNKVSAYDYK